MTTIPSVDELLLAGAHFGHQTRRWHPLMAPYIYQAQGGVHIIDLYKSHDLLEKAVTFLQKVSVAGGQVIFVGTKGQSKELITARAQAAGALFVTERWLGGTLTNYSELTKRLKYLKDYYKKSASDGYKDFTKKERLLLSREAEKMSKFLGGILELRGLPAAVVVVDPKREHIAVRECVRTGVPVIALADTNCDPRGIDYLIPTNDDAIKAVDLIISALASAVTVGDQKGVETQHVASNVQKSTNKELKTEDGLASLNLSARAQNALNKAGITSVAALKKTDLTTIKGLGAKSIEEIKKAIK